MRIRWLTVALLLPSAVLCTSNEPSLLSNLWTKLTAKPEAPLLHPLIRPLSHTSEQPVEALLDEAREDAWGGQRWIVLAAGPEDARSFIVSAIFNRSLTLLTEAQSRLAGLPQPAVVPDDDAEQERLRIYEEQSIDKMLSDEALRTELESWNWGRVDVEEGTRLLWRWWIWKVPTLLFLSRPTPYEPYAIRTLSLAWAPPPSPLELLTLLTAAEHQARFPFWVSELQPGGTREWVPEYLGWLSGAFAKLGTGLPGWALTTLSGLLAGTLLQYLHKPKKRAVPAGSKIAAKGTRGTATPSSSTIEAKKSQ